MDEVLPLPWEDICGCVPQKTPRDKAVDKLVKHVRDELWECHAVYLWTNSYTSTCSTINVGESLHCKRCGGERDLLPALVTLGEVVVTKHGSMWHTPPLKPT